MASTIYQPCYATREEVARALDVKAAAYNSAQLDRQIVAATDSAEDLCKRFFFSVVAQYTFDWPNFQYAYPWRLWLNQFELAAQPTLFESGFYTASPVVFPPGSYICGPVNSGPPFTYIDLRRDQNYSFGNNTTPQNDIAITGSFGFWTKTSPVGTLAAAMTDTTGTTVQSSVASGAGPGVGDVLNIDSEKMIIQDASYVSSGVLSSSGCTTASAADNTLGVPSGPAFNVGETLILDSETMLIVNILGNNLVMKRAWEGSVLSTHSTGVTIYVRRSLTVLRGALGTTAATHSVNAPMSINTVPALVKQLAVAEALVGTVQEPGGYTSGTTANSRANDVYGGTTHAQVREPIPGVGIAGLRDHVYTLYGRKARSRVI